MDKLPYIIVAFLAIIPAIIAKKKGRNVFIWWLYGFAFFLIALIHSLFLKDENNDPDEIYQFMMDVSTEKYKEVLINNNLGKYIKLFEDNNIIKLSGIKKLQERDFENMGINDVSERVKIMEIFRDENLLDKYNYFVIEKMNLYNNPISDKNNIIRKLILGERIKILELGEKYIYNSLPSKWAKVVTFDNNEGWCIFENLKKIK